jgi:hypothetical protein
MSDYEPGCNGELPVAPLTANQICSDCAGFDIEWMYRCEKHNTWRCRGCACPECSAEEWDDYYEDCGTMDLEDQLDRLLEAK